MRKSRKIILSVAGIIAVLMAAIIGYASTKPDDFRYERSILINAAPAAIYPYLSDLRKGAEWSPWNKLDPDIKETYSGSDSGVGSVYSWDGNSNVGKGNVTITELKPNELVRLWLDFEKPMKGTNTSDYVISREGEQTRVTWSMYGPQPLPAKIMSVFIDCEKMVGEQFDKGLASLKQIVERNRRNLFSTSIY